MKKKHLLITSVKNITYEKINVKLKEKVNMIFVEENVFWVNY